MSETDFRKRKAVIMRDVQEITERYERGYQEACRVHNVVKNTEAILDDLDKQFCDKTGLSNTDIAFLFVATGLQIARQYLLTNFPERQDDQSAAKQTKGHHEEHSNRVHRLYNPSLEEIITNPVPFDANVGANGALAGGGSLGHRATAIGHDPVLGLIFGTANIATSTLTTNKLISYHIYTNEHKRDYFKQTAQTNMVLFKTLEKMLYGGVEGKTIVAASLIKEIIHLRSDLYTKHSLPLPFISAVDPKMASALADYGFDMANLVTIGKQFSYAMLINSLIAMIHGIFYDGSDDPMEKKLYEVRTRKILSFSNAIASSTNVAVVFATQRYDMLDLGGLALTIHRIITDHAFVQKVKHEFIFGNYDKLIQGDYLTE